MAGMYPDMEAKSFVPPPAYADIIDQLNDNKFPARNYVPGKLETSTINIWEIILVLLLANKLLLFVGKEELSVNVFFGLCWVLFGFSIFIVITLCFCCKKRRLVLLSHGAQIIRLAGLVILFGNLVYGFIQKEDVFFGYKYKHDSAFNIIVAVFLYLIDFATAYWFLCVFYTCFTFLRNLNKADQSANVINK